MVHEEECDSIGQKYTKLDINLSPQVPGKQLPGEGGTFLKSAEVFTKLRRGNTHLPAAISKAKSSTPNEQTKTFRKMVLTC